LETDAANAPLSPVIISECGYLEPDQDDGVPPPADGDELPDYPQDHPVEAESDPKLFVQLASQIKLFGNAALKQGLNASSSDATLLFERAVEKYNKAVRYLDAIHPTPEDSDEMTHELKVEFYAIKVSSFLNLALVKTQRVDYVDVFNPVDYEYRHMASWSNGHWHKRLLKRCWTFMRDLRNTLLGMHRLP
jgi:peptidyl-prolyl isomerase D